MEKLYQKPRDILGGAFIISIGVIFLVGAQDLDIGSTFRMGPGYFPILLSLLLILLGAIIVLKALWGPRIKQDVADIPWKGLILITGSVVFFGATVRGIGLLPAVAVVSILTASISRFATAKAIILLTLIVTVGCVVIFVYGLGLPLPLIGKWLTPSYWQG